jgi:cell division protein FtsQ
MNAPLQLRAAAAPARSRRGASRAGDTSPRTIPGQRWLVPALFMVLLTAVGEMGFTAFREVANVPIRHVSVNGDFRFIDRARIEESMLPHLGTGYFMVNLPQIREELQRLPLVHEVTVRRAWPDRLLVYITEQVPVLRFGQDGYLNPYAEVFRPEAPLPGLDLPLVYGPPGSEKELLSDFDHFTEILDPAGLRIASLVLDGKHACRITLSNGTEVLLGRRDVERKLGLLARLLQTQWATERERMARIDMRYSNGVAVALRGATPAAEPAPAAQASPAAVPAER